MYVCEVAAAVVVVAAVVEEDVFPIAMAEAPKAVGGTNQNVVVRKKWMSHFLTDVFADFIGIVL